MKIFFVGCLLLASAFGLPQGGDNGKYGWPDEERYDITNSVDEEMSYDRPPPNLPLYLYKQITRMDPKQMQFVAEALKSFIKPVIKSAEFRVLTEFVDESMQLFRDDPQIKAMVRQGVDSLQDLYQDSNGRLVKELLVWLVSQYSNEETARSLSSLMSDLNPTIEAWIMNPMKQYYRSYITPTLAALSSSVTQMFGDDLASNEIARSARWSDVVDIYIERLSDMTSQANAILRETSRLI